ncbi:hypothetical protein BKA67DRAFT_127914 [Truncatella angustata]|uniref:Uncharacterized protein n=1 Tax=Truncatella angustata TaxID=152316 RepID=A0A9P8RFG0_9PEZI|nr:uncharacterized protein BKA67DRAFT_127914 [Truncatella angustata]KAH6645038.1 hypothetical protein BKA67DRAFT_127914 [Truncatella angustata]
MSSARVVEHASDRESACSSPSPARSRRPQADEIAEDFISIVLSGQAALKDRRVDDFEFTPDILGYVHRGARPGEVEDKLRGLISSFGRCQDFKYWLVWLHGSCLLRIMDLYKNGWTNLPVLRPRWHHVLAHLHMIVDQIAESRGHTTAFAVYRYLAERGLYLGKLANIRQKHVADVVRISAQVLSQKLVDLPKGYRAPDPAGWISSVVDLSRDQICKELGIPRLGGLTLPPERGGQALLLGVHLSRDYTSSVTCGGLVSPTTVMTSNTSVFLDSLTTIDAAGLDREWFSHLGRIDLRCD